MLEAQDMFRNANRVTRPEKALILGFMAGSRGMYQVNNLLLTQPNLVGSYLILPHKHEVNI